MSAALQLVVPASKARYTRAWPNHPRPNFCPDLSHPEWCSMQGRWYRVVNGCHIYKPDPPTQNGRQLAF